MNNKQLFISFLDEYAKENHFYLKRKNDTVFHLICGESVFTIEYCDIGYGKEFVTTTLNMKRVNEMLMNSICRITKEEVYYFLDNAIKGSSKDVFEPSKQDAIRPAYYQLNIKDTDFDVFDLVRAINAKTPFSFELATATKYIIRLKEDSIDKRINDLQKAVECINREIEYLKNKKEGSNE